MSNTSSSSSSGGGIGVLGLLQVAFVIMKLMKWGGVDQWSWTQVLIPTWIGFGIFGLVMLILLVIFIIAVVLKAN